MEYSASATASRFPPNPISNVFQVFSFRPSPQSPSPPSTQSPTRTTHHRRIIPNKQQSNKKKVKPFKEEDAFPCSLPLHNKNPRFIYKDIKNFARQNKLKEALTILDYMDQQGIPINSTTFSSLIAACIRTKSLPQGREVHAHIRINGLENNAFLRTKLVHMYTSCGSLEEARKLFDGLPCESVYPWNALLRGTVISGNRQYSDVLNTYSEMRALGIELNVYSFSSVIKSFAGAPALFQGLKTHALLIKNALGVIRSMQLSKHRPDSVAIARMLSVCGELKLLKLGKEIHGQILKRDFVSVHFVSAELINMYGTFGDVNKAKLVFDAVPVKGSMTWTALLRAHGYNHLYQDAIELFDQMRSNGYSPNQFTFEAILSICDRTGFINDACRIFNLMPKYKIEASKDHCAIMVRLLTRYGQVEKAQKFVKLSSYL
ncbi:Tetratricopeptide-like helical domain superfamily [Sesbania bispinosa]|nr:Tetratricopeptide-like helical domain superfamily [Sesbania bispinosa]